MCIEFEQRLGPIPEAWFDIEPDDFVYGRYAPHIVTSVYKISDVFNVFCIARSLLLDSHSHRNEPFIRSTELISSLMNYVICWDLSWQVLSFYYGEDCDELLYDRNYYLRALNRCTYTSLLYQLTLARDYKVREYLKSFESNNLWNLLRTTYNHYKHQGSFYIPGIGVQYRHSLFNFEGNSMPLLYKSEFNLDLWEQRLVNYNAQFQTYFNNVIHFVLPNDYNSQMSEEETASCFLRMNELSNKASKV